MIAGFQTILTATRVWLDVVDLARMRALFHCSFNLMLRQPLPLE